MRIPAKMSPPRQMTAPAYMAKVLKVDISVCAPEKSIVPWAWATALPTPANRIAVSVGPITCAARLSFRENRRNHRRAGRLSGVLHREIIGTSCGPEGAAICRDHGADLPGCLIR